MDARLIAQARAVKQRRRNKLPVLWLFTDSQRLPDPVAAIAKLPKFLSGVVLRYDHEPDATRVKQISAICRARGIAVVVAGDTRLAARLGAGVHLSRGRWPSQLRIRTLVTSSAHNSFELRRARLAGAGIIFLSPAFRSASHQDHPGLGATRWSNIARQAAGPKIYALGGVSSQSLNSLTRYCSGAGAISALSQ